jgi:hypothetical protein
MAIGRRPPISYAIVNNMLPPSIRATNLGISPQATTSTTWNNFENLEDASSGLKHPKRCSYTILESPPKDKWGAMAKAWANKILCNTKMCLGKNRWKVKV